MKRSLNIIIGTLLLFNGIAATYGGLNFILHPDGSSLHISTKWLETTPFHNYFIPGIILFIANGICSFLVFITLIMKNPNFAGFAMLQGVILTGWILIQIVMLQFVEPLHLWMVGVGVALIITGGLRNYLFEETFT